MRTVSADRLRQLLDYDPATGVFTWRTSRQGQSPKGTVAGSINGKGYHRIGIYGKSYATHRLVWLHVFGRFPCRVIDHINGNPTDNRLSNLRECSQQQNSINNRRSPPGKSGVRGVMWNSSCGKWQANISNNGRLIHLGVFENKDDAIATRKEAERTYHGEFAPTPMVCGKRWSK